MSDQRTLDRRIDLDWRRAPPPTDVDVVVVYRDGEREVVDPDHVRVHDDGVGVEDHPLQSKRVLQVEVDYTERERWLERLRGFFSEARADLRRRMGR